MICPSCLSTRMLCTFYLMVRASSTQDMQFFSNNCLNLPHHLRLAEHHHALFLLTTNVLTILYSLLLLLLDNIEQQGIEQKVRMFSTQKRQRKTSMCLSTSNCLSLCIKYRSWNLSYEQHLDLNSMTVQHLLLFLNICISA